MGGYIGAKTGTLVASASDIRGDISATDTTPEITLKNTTETDADGTRSGKITFKGEQSGGEESVLAQIQGSHDGTADDEKGDLIFKTNDGNDASSPTERVRINSAGDVLVSSPDPSLTITNTTHEDTDGGRESTIVFKGEQSGGELSTLAEIEASHDGTADDEKGDLIFRTNDGSDGASPTERVRIDSNGSIITATLGTDNVKLGEGAGVSIASGGTNNVTIGKNAGTAITTGDDNVAVGYQAGDALTTSEHNVAVGKEALSTETLGSYNTAIGTLALTTQNNADIDVYNTAVGALAGRYITTGNQNSLFGAQAGDALTTGQYNTALGYKALSLDTAGNRSTAVGYEALANLNFTSSNDNQNTAVGFHAGKEITTGTENVAIGGEALDACTVGNGNVAVGVQALSGDVNGSRSVAVGATALKLQEASGSSSNNYYNVAVGYDAGGNVTTGYYNTLIGVSAGNTLTTGTQNVFVGMDSRSASGSDGNQIAIGYDVDCIGGNYTTLGNNTIGRVYNQFSSNATWTRTSDERIKKDIETNTDLGLDFINDLRTVTYKWKAPSEHPTNFKSYNADQTEAAYTEKMYGFIAQEVKQALDDNNITGFNGWHVTPESQGSQQGVSYEMFVMPLVKAVQELSAKVDTLETENTAIKARLDALETE